MIPCDSKFCGGCNLKGMAPAFLVVCIIALPNFIIYDIASMKINICITTCASVEPKIMIHVLVLKVVSNNPVQLLPPGHDEKNITWWCTVDEYSNPFKWLSPKPECAEFLTHCDAIWWYAWVNKKYQIVMHFGYGNTMKYLLLCAYFL